MKGNVMEYEEWINIGIEKGFCSMPFCATHDGAPMHETEERAWEEGSDPCQVSVRLGSPDEWALPDWWFESETDGAQ